VEAANIFYGACHNAPRQGAGCAAGIWNRAAARALSHQPKRTLPMDMKRTIKAASDAVAEVFSAKPDKAGEMDILDKLHMGHDEVRELLEKIIESRKTAERKTLLVKIRKALIPHTKAE